MIVAIEQFDFALPVNCLANHTSHFRVHIDRIAIDTAQTTDKNTRHINGKRQHKQDNQRQLPGHVQQHGEQRHDNQGFTRDHSDHFRCQPRHIARIDREAIQQSTRISIAKLGIRQSQQTLKHFTTNTQKQIIGYPGRDITTAKSTYATQKHQPHNERRNRPDIRRLLSCKTFIQQRFHNNSQCRLGCRTDREENKGNDNGLPVLTQPHINATPKVELHWVGMCGARREY